jgi:hypothetical protein
MMIEQWSKYGWTFVLDLMQRNGLFTVIREFTSASDQFIAGQYIENGVARTLWFDVNQTLSNPISAPVDDARSFFVSPAAAFLLLMRYPKRFSPLEADRIKQESLQAFVDTQKRLKAWQRTPISNYDVIGRVRDEISHLLKWDSLVEELSNVQLSDIIFTSGVSFDTKAPLVSKLQSLAKERVEYFPQPFGIPMVANRGEAEGERWGKTDAFEKHTVRLIAVPKNYKTARVIAPENVYRQALARRYFVIADRYLPSLIKLHDQTQNQTYAYEGSLDGSLATLDLSAASDSLTPTLLWEVFPSSFMRIMEGVLPTHYVLNNHTFQLQSAATMGNSMTFWLESVVFAGICLAGVKYYNTFTGGGEGDIVSVYGDDIVVPTAAAQTVIEFLEHLGFIVNHDKSFFDAKERYRESCGEEYLEGICVSSRYFPRFPIEGELGGKLSTKTHTDGFTGATVDTLASLIDLQHKMFKICVPASVLLKEIIVEANPQITMSTPDEGFSDVWSYESRPVVWRAPGAKQLQLPDECPEGVERLTAADVLRYGHSCPVTVYDRADDRTDEVLLDLYKYQQFLKYGPRYDDDLLKQLGVSSVPLTFDEASTSPKVKWIKRG